MDKRIKAAALRILKLRPHACGELTEKLLAKGFTDLDIRPVINELIVSGLLDDRAFTKSWINYRLARPFGFKRIIQELKAKGVDQALIDESIQLSTENYNAQEIAFDLALRRWQRMPAIEPLRKKKRVLDFLLRRGFDLNIAMKVLKKL